MTVQGVIIVVGVMEIVAHAKPFIKIHVVPFVVTLFLAVMGALDFIVDALTLYLVVKFWIV